MLFHCTDTRSLRCLLHRRKLQRFWFLIESGGELNFLGRQFSSSSPNMVSQYAERKCPSWLLVYGFSAGVICWSTWKIQSKICKVCKISKISKACKISKICRISKMCKTVAYTLAGCSEQAAFSQDAMSPCSGNRGHLSVPKDCWNSYHRLQRLWPLSNRTKEWRPFILVLSIRSISV